MNESQLLKGILEGCILAVISSNETYGYEILTQLENYGMPNIQEGTLYPVLTRLEKKGFISCRKAASPLGPIRKYYSITSDGEKELAEFTGLYKNMTGIVDKILKEGEKSE